MLAKAWGQGLGAGLGDCLERAMKRLWLSRGRFNSSVVFIYKVECVCPNLCNYLPQINDSHYL